jgi:SAM-dependent methyltransferase
MQTVTSLKNWLRALHTWVTPVIDVRVPARAIYRYPRFWVDWMRYASMSGAERLRLRNARPCLFDKTSTTAFDAHYVFLNAWAFRKIEANGPSMHVDVGSQVGFVTLLSAVTSTLFTDIRPLEVKMSGLKNVAGSILELPFQDGGIASVSCLHVIEHIGLGRYGDALDPSGSRRAIAELSRVIAPGGNLYVGLPVGRPRVCFNGHRVHDPCEVEGLFAEQGLHLVEFAAVNTEGRYLANVRLGDLKGQDYACGMYWLQRPVQQ